MKVVIIIPARYGSTRFPGKVLVSLFDKPLIQWVYERAINSGIKDVFIATDSTKVKEVAEAFGATVIMTSPEHPSGTDRIAEAVEVLGLPEDTLIINIQADQPLLPYDYVPKLVQLFEEFKDIAIGTLATPIKDPSEVTNPNKVKVVLDHKGYALYFSRAPIPYGRDEFYHEFYLKHIGVYAYYKGFLKKFVNLPKGRLEEIEKLEQLRAMEAGYKIGVKVVDKNPPEVDTPEDLEYIIQNYEKEFKK
ncbi:MAG: 3-deoxy-manno-octulosonate cytidylyltransferase [Thermodesulfobacteria bacterium]|nr:3-deoxy-manno-octulosonate cytidylyltransferase [Thermodesulfobacteriota bacterium]